MKIIVDLDRYHEEHHILSSLYEIYEALPWEEVTILIKYEQGGYIDCGVLLFLVAVYNELKEDGYNILVEFPNIGSEDRIRYLSRIDFFNLLDIPIAEFFTRQDSSGRFIEITNIGKGPATYALTEEIIGIMEQSLNVSDEQLGAIVFAFNELISNVELHSKSRNGGYIYCQKYPNKGIIDLVIVDAGQGVLKSLDKGDDRLSNREALAKSIQFGVTSGQGHGHGLYFIQKLIAQNNGEMVLISGSDSLYLKGSKVKIIKNEEWKGTYIRCKFQINDLLNANADFFSEYK